MARRALSGLATETAGARRGAAPVALAALALCLMAVQASLAFGGVADAWLHAAAFVLALLLVVSCLAMERLQLRSMGWQNALLRRAVDQSSAMVVITDTDAHIQYVNPHFTEVTGYTLDDVRGRNPSLLAAGSTLRSVYRELWRAIGAGGRWRGELCNRNRDGETYWVAASISAVRDPEGHTTHYLAVEEDVTARKDAEQALRELTQALEQRVAERTEALERANGELEAFNSTLSHDLRRPLQTIGGFAELLREDCDEALGEPGRDYVQRIQRAVDRMRVLIDEMLALARVQQAPVVRRDCDLTSMAREIVEDLRRAEPERRVEVRIAEGLRAKGDPDLCRVALENLLHNAWKYTRPRPHARIEVGVAGAPFYVRDNGIGLDVEASAARLFQPFQRFHGEPGIEGNGVGLATVRRVAERHGGRVWVESSPGAGATFYFTFG